MRLFQETGRRLRYAIAPILCASLMGYAGYHFVEGERGIKAWWSVDQQIEEAERERDTVLAERERLEARVRLLREDSLNSDMLDERVRRILNYGREGELVILYERPLPRDH